MIINRELKFRIWDGINKKWLLNTNWELYSNFNYVYPKALLGHILQQSTELKDRNGMEIYDGDILKERDNNYEWSYFEVKYHKGGFWGLFSKNFEGKEILCGPLWDFCTKNYSKVKLSIAGNIFENSDLLKKVR